MENIKKLDFILNFENMNLSNIRFIRGLGIIENRLIISFISESRLLDIEIETNFRIRTNNKIITNYNDLYIDVNRNNLPINEYRNQNNIEKSYLEFKLEQVNKELIGLKPMLIQFENYGDIHIEFKNKIVIEIFNDTNLEGATLYRFLYKNKDNVESYEFIIENGSLISKGIDTTVYYPK